MQADSPWQQHASPHNNTDSGWQQQQRQVRADRLFRGQGARLYSLEEFVACKTEEPSIAIC